MAVMAAAETIVRDLFERYMRDPGAMPESWRASAESDGRGGPRRAWWPTSSPA